MAGYGYANWRYVHGPGLDDPLVAVHPAGATQSKYYYLTDGRGRHLAFTDSTGKNFMEPESVEGPEHARYYTEGGNQASSIEKSNGFDNVRAGSDNAPQLSYYRNRYYDQQTGRFISEDPIGIAGGVNLYQYGANNPAMFTDPFGLCPEEAGGDGATEKYADCPPGTEGYRTYLHSMGTVDNATSLVERNANRSASSNQGAPAGLPRFVFPPIGNARPFQTCPDEVTGVFTQSARMRRGDGALQYATVDVSVWRVQLGVDSARNMVGIYQGSIRAIVAPGAGAAADFWSGEVRGIAWCGSGLAKLHATGRP